MTTPVQYDYIIAGAGCAGLSLALHLIYSGGFRQKKFLIVDQDVKKTNDRTWCFWQKKEGIFEPIVRHAWSRIAFHGEGKDLQRDLGNYRYKMIQGLDFYDFCLDIIASQPNFQIRNSRVDHVFSTEWSTGIICGSETIHAHYVFNSILYEKPKLSEKQYWMLQHFRGWTIETGTDVFDPERLTMMDFRTPQDMGTCYFYLLPFGRRKALVEYTVFSESVLPDTVYESRLKQYISTILTIDTYTVLEDERGMIPMTNFRFSRHQNKVVNIGTAGGQTKAISGYTFNFIQKNSEAIVKRMTTRGDPFVKSGDLRFSIYDNVLLHVLAHKMVSGEKMFTRLFEKNPVETVLRFLDNESSVAEEGRIFLKMPLFPFLRAAAEQLF